jgi:hypothetical protein
MSMHGQPLAFSCFRCRSLDLAALPAQPKCLSSSLRQRRAFTFASSCKYSNRRAKLGRFASQKRLPARKACMRRRLRSQEFLPPSRPDTLALRGRVARKQQQTPRKTPLWHANCSQRNKLQPCSPNATNDARVQHADRYPSMLFAGSPRKKPLRGLSPRQRLVLPGSCNAALLAAAPPQQRQHAQPEKRQRRRLRDHLEDMNDRLVVGVVLQDV